MNHEFYEKEVLEEFTSEFYEDLNNYGRERGYVRAPYKFDEMEFIILLSAKYFFSLSMLPILAYPEMIDGKTFYRVIAFDHRNLNRFINGIYPIGKHKSYKYENR